MASTIRADESDALMRAVHALDEGAILAYPAGERYALGADALSEEAVERAFSASARPADAAMSVLVSDFEEARHVAFVTPLARRLAESFLPGPMVIVLRARATAPDALLGGGETIGVRVPAEPFARELARHHGPVTAANAALARQPSVRHVADARAVLKEKARLYVDAGERPGARATVVDATGVEPRVLREGAIDRARVEGVRAGA